MHVHACVPHDRTLTGTLALTVTVSYGVLLYAFPVMLGPMHQELGWSMTLLTGGYSAAALAAGVCALPVGRWIDMHGAHVVMTTGSVSAALLMLAWSRVSDPVTYVLVWIGLGACMAAVFYEPAFAVVAQQVRVHRSRSLAVITLAGGLASTIFVPLSHVLADHLGWRTAVAALAAVLGATTIVPHALLLRPSASRHAVPVGALPPRPFVAAGVAVRTPAFRLLAAAFLLFTTVNVVMVVHLVPMLMERGMTAGAAAGALALLGLAKLPGRLVIAHLAVRTSARTAMVGVLVAQVVAFGALTFIREPLGLWLFITLFGAADGAGTPLRGELLALLFGPGEYGRIGGALAFVLSLGRAAAPVGGSVLLAALGSYDAVPAVLGVSLCGAALAMRRLPRSEQSRAAASFPFTPRLHP